MKARLYTTFHESICTRTKDGLTNADIVINRFPKEEVFFAMDALLKEGYGVKLTERRFGLGYIVEITW